MESIPPAFLCSLAGRYDNPIPMRFLAPHRLFKNSSSGSGIGVKTSRISNNARNKKLRKILNADSEIIFYFSPDQRQIENMTKRNTVRGGRRHLMAEFMADTMEDQLLAVFTEGGVGGSAELLVSTDRGAAIQQFINAWNTVIYLKWTDVYGTLDSSNSPEKRLLYITTVPRT